MILRALPPEGAASLTPGRGLLELEGRSLYLHVLEFLAFRAFYSCSKNLPNVGTVCTFLMLKSELPASCFFDSLSTFCCVFCWSTARGSSTRGRKRRRRKCSNNLFAGISPVHNPLRVRRESVFLESKKRGIQTDLSAKSGKVLALGNDISGRDL